MDKLLLFLMIVLFSVGVGSAAIYGGETDTDTVRHHVDTMKTNTVSILKEANETLTSQ